MNSSSIIVTQTMTRSSLLLLLSFLGIGSVFSYSVQTLSSVIFHPSPPTITTTFDNDTMSTEIYIVRLIASGILVLMGGFFAGLYP